MRAKGKRDLGQLRSPRDARRTPPPEAMSVPLHSCSIDPSLGVLGRDWTLLILRDITFHAPVTPAFLRTRNPRMGREVLNRRLRELVAAGVIAQIQRGPDPTAGYRLTPAGRDLVPVLSALILHQVRKRPPGSADHAPPSFDEDSTENPVATSSTGGRPGLTRNEAPPARRPGPRSRSGDGR